MAFNKTFTYPNGLSGNYVQIGGYRHDRRTRSASFHFDLFASAAHATAAPTSAIRPIIAKLRLEGAKFDEWVSNEALASAGQTLLQRAYAAARVEPMLCDFPPAAGQQTVFSDATDV